MKTPTRFLKAALLAGLFPSAEVSDACPVCHSETGKQVRAGIFNEEFGTNLLTTLLPFPVVLGVAAALHYGFSPKRGDVPSGSSAEIH
jgi:hypothetical protein